MGAEWEPSGVSMGGVVALLWLGSTGRCKTSSERAAVVRIRVPAQLRVALDPPRHFMVILAKRGQRPSKYLVEGRSPGRKANNETASMDSAARFE